MTGWCVCMSSRAERCGTKQRRQKIDRCQRFQTLLRAAATEGTPIRSSDLAQLRAGELLKGGQLPQVRARVLNPDAVAPGVCTQIYQATRDSD